MSPIQAGIFAGLLLLAATAALGLAADGAALWRVLAAPDATCGPSDLDSRRLARVYADASPTPLWIGDSGPLPRAAQLRAVLERSEDDGLPPARYRLAAIDARWHATNATERACLELLLTAAFDRYARDLSRGQFAPRDADRTWHIATSSVDPLTVLGAVSAGADVAAALDALRPAHGLYRRLHGALATYRRLAEHGGWDTALPASRLGPGDEGPGVAALRTRLRREGDLGSVPAEDERRWDSGLTDAVRRFQRRHGLLADGVVGPRTLAALATPVNERIAQLRRGMERLRWMPRELGQHYVLVNTAGFELTVIEDDRPVLGMRVIVGTRDQSTPSFVATLTSLVINPYWNVPVRIARDKLRPHELRSPGYLAARGFRVLDPRTAQWRDPDAASLRGDAPRLRQDPGPGNLMGRLSFVLPNRFDIFLHDTPDRSLFEREARACSEGCVRIEAAMALALHALRRAPDWTADRIQAEIDALHHRVLALPEPMAVYIVYLPTWVDEDGLVHFRPDHYGRDAELARHFPAR